MVNKSLNEVMSTWKKKDLESPLVSIECITYNHEKYIADTLDGFFMQVTDFPFEVIVHDDASTDKTADIIREYEVKYPGIIKPIYEDENQYSKHNGALERIINAQLKGKYIAICEGDDYWIDSLKLQKQVNLLEAHPDYGMCYGRAQVFSEKFGQLTNNIWGSQNNGIIDLLTKQVVGIPTLTICFRKEIFDEYIQNVDPSKKGWLLGDYPLTLWFALKSRIFFMNEILAVYRDIPNSASHQQQKEKMESFVDSIFSIKLFFVNKYNIKVDLISLNDSKYRRLLSYALELQDRKYASKIINKIKHKRKREYLYKVIFSSNLLFIIYKLYRGYKKNKSLSGK